MTLKPFFIRKVKEGRNSVLFQTAEGNILYEKLANTIHHGEDELEKLQEKIDSIEYNPLFESNSLSQKKGEKLENLILNVTESCNLSCSYCIFSGNYENERLENNSNMSMETAKKAIDLFIPKSKDPALISFYGGEPMKNMSLVKEVINYTRNNFPQKNVAFSMASNFCEADKHIRDIINSEIYVAISLDGPREIHDKYRKFKNGKPTYDKIIENLKKFEDFSPGYSSNHFSYNITYNDVNDILDIVAFFQKNEELMGARISGLEPKGLKVSLKPVDNSVVFNLSLDYLEKILSEKDPRILRGFFDQKLRNIASRSREIMPEQLKLNGCCYPGNRKLFVNTNGDFYMCERFGDRVPIGDINKGMIQDHINKSIEKFLYIRNANCTKDCWAQRICTPCIQSSKDTKEDISEYGLSQTCDSAKSQILIALAQYVSLAKEGDTLKKYLKSIELKNKIHKNEKILD